MSLTSYRAAPPRGTGVCVGACCRGPGFVDFGGGLWRCEEVLALSLAVALAVGWGRRFLARRLWGLGCPPCGLAGLGWFGALWPVARFWARGFWARGCVVLFLLFCFKESLRCKGSLLGGPGGDLLSHALRRSTIGAEGFHGRVRDGIGWDTLAMTTRSSEQSVASRGMAALGWTWVGLGVACAAGARPGFGRAAWRAPGCWILLCDVWLFLLWMGLGS
jgi:hypothetical protein